MTAPPPERTVAGRYRLERVLGRGGAGVVWAATDNLLGRSVAVKEIRLPDAVDVQEVEVLRARVMREARTAARLNDPSIVPVYDVLEEDERLFLIMELVRARSLADIIRDDGALSPRDTARFGLGLLGALQTAHAAGVLHRDIKPANILVSDEGRVRLTDFGIAAIAGDPQLTSTGMLVGSPSYIPPERVRGEAGSPASDLWSLGATLFTAVEGQVPYPGEHPLAVLTAILENRRRPCRLAGPLTSLLDDLLDRPERERPDAGEIRGRLASAVSGSSAYPGASRPSGPPPRQPPSGGHHPPGSRHSSGPQHSVPTYPPPATGARPTSATGNAGSGSRPGTGTTGGYPGGSTAPRMPQYRSAPTAGSAGYTGPPSFVGTPGRAPGQVAPQRVAVPHRRGLPVAVRILLGIAALIAAYLLAGGIAYAVSVSVLSAPADPVLQTSQQVPEALLVNVPTGDGALSGAPAAGPPGRPPQALHAAVTP